MTRAKRPGEFVCDCPAYPFPHRMFGGKCDGYSYAEDYWEDHYGSGDCQHCNQYDSANVSCGVVEGRENPLLCDAVDAFISFNSIKMPKK